MADRSLLNRALEEMAGNEAQIQAINETSHCVVLAGPGSGKTKTLTTAMTRALLEDVEEPRGIACITYSNECAGELETRLARLGVERDERIYIGTIHSFAMAHIIIPFARCVFPNVSTLAVANKQQEEDAKSEAYRQVFGAAGNSTETWEEASMKRKTQMDRNTVEWSREPELSRMIEIYENLLMQDGLIDIEGMPLLAYRMVNEHPWIGQSVKAKFPILFIDEYQDLGVALHRLVLKLCFEDGIRLFAVGDPDQSVYGFTGARPELFRDLSNRPDVRRIVLPFNYRCGVSIIEASKAALGEEREFRAPDGAHRGNILFDPVDGGLEAQAAFIMESLIPAFIRSGVRLEEMAILYRAAYQGDTLASAAETANVPSVRSDSRSLIKRSNKLSRLIEASASWVTGGWRDASPPFRKLAFEATNLVFGAVPSTEERRYIEDMLMGFLHRTRDVTGSTHDWLVDFNDSLVTPWRTRARNVMDEWDVIDRMIEHTDPQRGNHDMPLPHFSGRMAEAGRVNLMTLHSAKGREFDVVILFDMNAGSMPARRDMANERKILEARRTFYVGVTRARRELRLVVRRRGASPWVYDLHRRLQREGMLAEAQTGA